jgi:hypothetical protein
MWSRRLLAAFNVRPFGTNWRLIWPLLTSAWASRHLSMPVALRSPSAPLQISPGMTHPPSRLYLSDIHRSVPCKFRALTILAVLPRRAASYPLPVRQASALPSASSRFAVTCDTLAVRLTLPLAGRVEDLHLQVSAPCRAHKKKTGETVRRSVKSPLSIFPWLRFVIPLEAESRSIRPIAA